METVLSRAKAYLHTNLLISSGFNLDPQGRGSRWTRLNVRRDFLYLQYMRLQHYTLLDSNNYMLAHATNIQTGANGGGRLEYVKFYTPTFTLTGSATFAPRTHCSYDAYSQVFQCPTQQMGIVLEGTDENGYLFQRQSGSLCPGAPVTRSKQWHRQGGGGIKLVGFNQATGLGPDRKGVG